MLVGLWKFCTSENWEIVTLVDALSREDFPEKPRV